MNVDEYGTSWQDVKNWFRNVGQKIGNWFESNWKKLVVGSVFIVAGAVVTFFTAGMGTAGLLAAGGALLSSAKAVTVSMAISGGIGAIVGGINGGEQGALRGFGDGLANGFMWGGIFAGGAQIVSGVFRTAANFGASTGRKGGLQLSQNLKVLSPNNIKFYENGGTLIKIGKNFRLDVGAQTLLHMHISGFNHIPIGTIIASIIGALSFIWN